ncbi:alpha/beta hydrolase [Bacillus sp. FJAT-22090]|uniref:alpha/beta fold hydrolase n=1 Tax=Bacillus sp. FJAT-22090 TaxID=1581038 RepID=UPI0006AF7503|nr:alpha/beta hydrolase [Bacillus sp. FJAT-22090]ALC87558.1 alpha/beta hydrolase [Bacillus sp. FJAT-22090]
MKTVQIKGSSVAYIDEGQGKVLFLIHGFCGSSAYWCRVVPLLANQYRVIAIDLPGHGESEVQDNVNQIDDYADFIHQFLDSLELDKVTMLGHSLGGYLTLAFAEKYSERLNGFSLIHSTGLPDSEEAKKGRDTSALKIDDEGIEVFVDGLIPKLFAPNNVKSHQNLVEEAIKIGYSTSPIGAKNALMAMRDRKDRREIINITKLPVVLVAGAEDQLIPSEKTFTANGVNIKQVVLKDVGHMSMYEAPKELVKIFEDSKTFS